MHVAARRLFVLLLIAASAAACRKDQPAPSPGPAASAPAALPPGHPPLDAAPPAGATAGGSVSGTVSLSPSVASRAKGPVLFLIARSAADRQILAVRREEGVTFPFAFTISAADAMVSGTSFTGPLDITARLSQSGDAAPAKGDLEGVARGVAVGAKDVAIALDSVRQ
jgi:cytochrome c-type biogenesis protein CcmH